MPISVLHIGSAWPAAPIPSVRQPTWEQIEAAILQMDGHTRCEVTLVIVVEVHMLMLGGGADGRYVCNAEFPKGSYVLCDPTQPEGKPVLINAGQPSLYDPRHVVDVGKVLQAARHFATTGEMDPSLVWFKY